MNYLLELISPPDGEPVTLDELKRHLRTFSDTSQDADLNALIRGGREWAEQFSGYALISQGWRLTFETSPLLIGNVVSGFLYAPYYSRAWRTPDMTNTGEIRLPRTPVISVDKFVTVDSQGNEVAVDPATFNLREPLSRWPRLVSLGGWFTGSFRVEFTAGYEDEDNIPVVFKQAIKLWAEAHYDRDLDAMPKYLQAAEAVLRNFQANVQLA
jgi:hypothetical protein